jgi:hypothetical protein
MICAWICKGARRGKSKGRENPPLANFGIRNVSGFPRVSSYRYRALTEPKDSSSTGVASALKEKIGSS